MVKKYRFFFLSFLMVLVANQILGENNTKHKNKLFTKKSHSRVNDFKKISPHCYPYSHINTSPLCYPSLYTYILLQKIYKKIKNELKKPSCKLGLEDFLC